MSIPPYSSTGYFCTGCDQWVRMSDRHTCPGKHTKISTAIHATVSNGYLWHPEKSTEQILLEKILARLERIEQLLQEREWR